MRTVALNSILRAYLSYGENTAVIAAPLCMYTMHVVTPCCSTYAEGSPDDLPCLSPEVCQLPRTSSADSSR